jgi:Ca2+ transporting ATPase
MERSFLSSSEDVLAHFGVDRKTGLSNEQVLKSRQTYGSNGEWISATYP